MKYHGTSVFQGPQGTLVKVIKECSQMVPLAENTKPEADKQKQRLRTLSWRQLTQRLIHDLVLARGEARGGGECWGSYGQRQRQCRSTGGLAEAFCPWEERFSSQEDCS